MMLPMCEGGLIRSAELQKHPLGKQQKGHATLRPKRMFCFNKAVYAVVFFFFIAEHVKKIEKT